MGAFPHPGAATRAFRAAAAVQHARLLTEDGEELADGLARIDLDAPFFDAPPTMVLLDLEPVAPLVRVIGLGRREFRLELEDGLAISARVVGSVRSVGRRRFCFLHVLSAPVSAYEIGDLAAAALG